jgi:hypothetical protein
LAAPLLSGLPTLFLRSSTSLSLCLPFILCPFSSVGVSQHLPLFWSRLSIIMFHCVSWEMSFCLLHVFLYFLFSNPCSWHKTVRYGCCLNKCFSCILFYDIESAAAVAAVKVNNETEM